MPAPLAAKWSIPAFAILLGIVVAATMLVTKHESDQRHTTSIAGFLWPDPPAVGELSLVDHHGAGFNTERLRGKWSFVFFGYTHCPDVCPGTLQQFKLVDETLGRPDDVQYLFVSVDPARDTPDVLAGYVTWFSPRILGLTGEAAAISAFARKLGAAFVPDAPGTDGSYEVSHTVAFMLLDPQGRFVGVFSAPHHPDEIVARFAAMRSVIEDDA